MRLFTPKAYKSFFPSLAALISRSSSLKHFFSFCFCSEAALMMNFRVTDKEGRVIKTGWSLRHDGSPTKCLWEKKIGVEDNNQASLINCWSQCELRSCLKRENMRLGLEIPSHFAERHLIDKVSCPIPTENWPFFSNFEALVMSLVLVRISRSSWLIDY